MSLICFNNSNTTAKKCGEIFITIKKNTKNVYSFNCWFCGTICLQLKKFTLHLEQKHVNQLDEIIYSNSKDGKEDEKVEIEKLEEIGSSDLVTEIKVEECANDDIKSESREDCFKDMTKGMEKDNLATSFQDPLETFEEKIDASSLSTPTEYNDFMEIAKHPSIYTDNEQIDVEMHIFSDDYQEDDNSDSSGEVYSTDCDLKNDKSMKKKSAKPNTKAEEKELTLALIDEYQKCPKLWNPTMLTRSIFLQKDELLQNITDSLNAKLKMKLKLYMVKKKLNTLCKQYEKEIERQLKGNGETNATNSDLWFYENMNFLKTIFENKFKRKKPTHKVKPLDDSLVCGLIDIYQNYNSLWDVTHLAYTVKDKRHEIMQSMLAEIKTTMNISLDAYKLEKHLNYLHKTYAKDKRLKLECELKAKDFQPTKSYFDKCQFLENNQGPFKCTNCNDIIETYNDFQIHKSQHDGSMPFICQECGMGFKKITNYTVHAKRHLRVFKFHCAICGKGYPFNAELDLHMRSHTGAQPYLCSICGEGFRTNISYDNHIRRHEKRFKYFCHICKRGFNHMTRLNDHVKAHLNVRDVICTVCGKGFTSRKYLNHHKRIHEGKNYNCNICGKSFAQDAGLRAHKKHHGTPIGVSSIQKEKNKYKVS